MSRVMKWAICPRDLSQGLFLTPEQATDIVNVWVFMNANTMFKNIFNGQLSIQETIASLCLQSNWPTVDFLYESYLRLDCTIKSAANFTNVYDSTITYMDEIRVLLTVTGD